ncbi:MAG: hypothetical protein JXR77_12655 [Lentisphaeria bacterium]|nr:hypothetical protein [Lentisphaeria bacterium]
MRSPCPVPVGRPLRLEVDGRGERLTVRVDGETYLRLEPPRSLAGAVALVCSGRSATAFSETRLFAEPVRDWEQPVNIERFADDPYMQGWASPRYAWLRLQAAEDAAPDAFPQFFRHTGDFYGPFRITLPVQDGFAVFFGHDDMLPQRSYCVEVRIAPDRSRGSVILSRHQATLARGSFTPVERTILPGQQIIDEKIGALPRTPDTVCDGTLELHRDGSVVWGLMDGKEVFSFHDPEPLAGRALALRVPAPIDFIHVGVERGRIKDDLFDRVAVDWVTVGDWEVTNRFACDPRWSHMNGQSKGVASLWSKYAFDGDYTIEYYAGMRMRQGDMMEGAAQMYYPRVGDINVALSTRPWDLFGGYNILVAAWDPMWTERWTRFLRRDSLVQETDMELIPRGRERRPRTRAVEVEWDPGGRPVHGAWYAVKIRRTGSRYDVWFDNVPVFSVTDPDPLAARRIALWTQHNSIVIARVKIGYRTCQKIVEVSPAEPAEATLAQSPGGRLPPPFRLSCPSHPGCDLDFETPGEHGILPWGGDQSAEISVAEGADGGNALRLENLYPGGDFGILLPARGLDLGRECRLEMDFSAQPGVLVNLYLAFSDRPAERLFAVLTGPDQEGPNMTLLSSDSRVPADGQWHHVVLDLAALARQRLPRRGTYRTVFCMVGMLHEGYLNAGLGGNPAGAVYRLDNLRITNPGGPTVAAQWEGDPDTPLEAWTWVDNQPDSARPPNALPMNAPCALLEAPGPGDWFLHGACLHEGETFPTPALPLRVGTPLAVAATEPAPGQPWGGDRIDVSFAAATGHPELHHAALTVAGKKVPVDITTASYDAATRTLAVDVRYAGEVIAAGSTVELAIEVADTRNGSPGVAPGGSISEPSVDLVHRWQATMDPTRDRQGPDLRFAGDVLRQADFERGWGQARLLSPPEEVDAALLPRQPDGFALQMRNAVCGSTFSIDFGFPPFPFGKYPLLAFDYRVDAYARCDFMFRLMGQQQILGFTDCDDSTGSTMMGALENIVRDGAWHHAEKDLTALLPRVHFRNVRGMQTVTQVGLGDWVYPSNAPGAVVAVDNVTLVPVIGTTAAPFELAWEAFDISGVDAYSYLWDHLPDTEPDTTPETDQPKAAFAMLPEGDAYFHVRARDGAGNWSRTLHARFLVDNQPPTIAATEPADGGQVAADSILLRFEPSLAALDPSQIALSLNGKPLSLKSSEAVWDADTREFSWDMLSDWSLLRGSIPDGKEMRLEVSGVRDFAGNEMPPLAWGWTVCYAADRKGPPPPRLWGYGHNFDLYDHFGSQAALLWRPYGSRNGEETQIETASLPGVGSCLEVRKVGQGTRFGAYRSTSSLSLKTTPLFSFDYCIMPGTKVNLLLYAEREWRQITMTGSQRYPELGRIEDARDDGTWRTALLDLAEITAGKINDNPEAEVRLVAFGDWGGRNAIGSRFYLDNLAFLGPSCPLPLVRYSAADATGISMYRIAFNQEPKAEPEIEAESRGTSPLLAAADQPGLWYIHVRARDGAGNWGDTLHFPYYCTEPVADRGDNGFEGDGKWRVVPSRRDSQAYLYEAMAGRSNRFLGVQLVMASTAEIEVSRSVSMEMKALPVITADVYVHGSKPIEIAPCVRPTGTQGVLSTGTRVSLEPGQWHRGVRFAFPEDLALPPVPPPQPAPEPTGTRKPRTTRRTTEDQHGIRGLGFVLYPDRRGRDTVLIDHVTVNGRLVAEE